MNTGKNSKVIRRDWPLFIPIFPSILTFLVHCGVLGTLCKRNEKNTLILAEQGSKWHCFRWIDCLHFGHAYYSWSWIILKWLQLFDWTCTINHILEQQTSWKYILVNSRINLVSDSKLATVSHISLDFFVPGPMLRSEVNQSTSFTQQSATLMKSELKSVFCLTNKTSNGFMCSS